MLIDLLPTLFKGFRHPLPMLFSVIGYAFCHCWPAMTVLLANKVVIVTSIF